MKNVYFLLCSLLIAKSVSAQSNEVESANPLRLVQSPVSLTYVEPELTLASKTEAINEKLFPYPKFLKTKSGRKIITGFYVQYGYNKDWYTNSNIHVKMSNGNNFVLHDAKAHDKTDFDDITRSPIEVTLPQFCFRIGLYLNESHSRAIEISYDHIKYVVTDGQVVHVTGQIDGEHVDANMLMDPKTFMHLEHTDGGNLVHFSYVEKHPLFTDKKNPDHKWLEYVLKLGAGFNYPRTDFTWRGDELNNKFHIAGFNISGEASMRFYPVKFLYLDCGYRSGYVNYLNALADTKEMSGNRVHHQFGYMEMVASLGCDIRF